ncbi:MAG: hypothetical protein IT372_15575 [Polyangiaceae bacterium]|nr:hypothetical protein [Polyangiaceae bacterium]
MSPFREPPEVELGPLEVGLQRAARRAMMGTIPSGGRLVALRPRAATHAAGALGSMGLFLVLALGLAASAVGWSPLSAAGTASVVALVIAGGLALAVVLRALDGPRDRRTFRGDVVGRAARRALRRTLRLAAHAVRSPERFGARRVAALRRTLGMLSDPLIAAWIPADVIGRTELLLARAAAASGGARWSRDERLLAEVRALLRAAVDHLAEPEPARSDLRALEALVDLRGSGSPPGALRPERRLEPAEPAPWLRPSRSAGPAPPPWRVGDELERDDLEDDGALDGEDDRTERVARSVRGTLHR